MIIDSNRVISEKDLFPLVEECIGQRKPVKFVVSGNSMNPLIVHNRDSVLLEWINVEQLKRGDIILFHTPSGKHILHRITKVVEDGFFTTGDGNLYCDGFVSKDAVVGKVTRIYRKNKEIFCSGCVFCVYSFWWMAAFPVRRYLQKVILGALKLKQKLY